MKRMSITLCVVFALLTFVMPAAAADVAGDWKLDGSISQFPVDLVCSIKQNGTKLTGNCKGSDIGELAISGDTEGNTAKWSYDVNFQGQQFTIVYNATLESPTTMKGTITVAGNAAGSFNGKKQ